MKTVDQPSLANEDHQTSEDVSADTLSLSARPWKGRAVDQEAKKWREEITPLVRFILATMMNPVPGLTAENSGLSYSATTAIEWAEYAIYKPEANPKDRTAFLGWLGEACALSDKLSGGNGQGVAHMFFSRLMKYWTGTAWKETANPDWALPLLQNIFNSLSLSKYPSSLTRTTAIDDLQEFLDGHDRIKSDGLHGQPRNTKGFSWNQQTLNSCWAWMLLGQEQPDRIPRRLIERLNEFRGHYVPTVFYTDIQNRILSTWELRVLTEFVEQIPGPADSATQTNEGLAKPNRSTKPRVI